MLEVGFMKIVQVLTLVLLFGLVHFLNRSSQAAIRPSLTITKPLEGETIEGYIVEVRFELKNFQLKDNRAGLANVVGQGHLNLWLDVPGTTTETARRWFRNTPYIFADVPAGEHVLTVELVGNDGQPLADRIFQTIKFQTAAPEGSESEAVDEQKLAKSDLVATETVNPRSDLNLLIAFLIGSLSLISGTVCLILLRKK